MAPIGPSPALARALLPSASMSFRPALVTLLGASAALTACALTLEGEAAVPALMREAGASYVGSEACRECHPDLYDGWRETRHPYQEQLAGPDTVVAPFDGQSFTMDGVEMRAWRDGDRYFVTTLGPDGEMHDYPVSRTIGGFYKQRFVTVVDGHEAVLPVQWNHRTQHWKPYSAVGHETVGTEKFWASIQNEWAPRCSGCHTVGTEMVARDDGGFDARYAELGVGCESCHGPASLHLEDPEAGNLILNPADLDLELQVDVCGACHSRGHAEVDEHGAPTRLRFPHDWLPGEPLLEHYGLDQPVPGETTASHWPDGSSRAHHQQAMDYRHDLHYTKAGMSCTSCHDPHGRPHPGETHLPARDDSLCLSCHEWTTAQIAEHTHHDPEDAGSTCIECHMPKIVNHAEKLELRSHTRWSPDPDQSWRTGMPDACTRCHDDRDQEWAALWSWKWWGLGSGNPAANAPLR